ncbi:MAG: hypothetical protein IJ773_11670 [Lachnospiraceae bacterium]|nr:hypothetical protein [Lachnospiraceae bacterium]
MKLKKLVSLVAAALTVCLLMAACGGSTGAKVDGTYTVKLDSNAYFEAEEVKNDLGQTDKRPDGTDAQVGFSRLFGMLDDRVADKSGVPEYYTATLVLSGDSYKLTKKIAVDMDHVSDSVKGMISSGTPVLELTFSGKFTSADGKVTLAVPARVDANISPVAGMADAYTRFGGTYTDVSADAADAESYPGKFFYYFNTLYFVENSAVAEMTVTIDGNNGTFTMN